MPITPLHLGVLAPLNHFYPKKVSNVSFILVNLWLDAVAFMYLILDMNHIYSLEDVHGNHSMLYALILATFVAIPGILSMRWVLGAYIGGVTHILLDMLVHSDVFPMAPWIETNPFYLGEYALPVISWLLVPLCAWYGVQVYRALHSPTLKDEEPSQLH